METETVIVRGQAYVLTPMEENKLATYRKICYIVATVKTKLFYEKRKVTPEELATIFAASCYLCEMATGISQEVSQTLSNDERLEILVPQDKLNGVFVTKVQKKHLIWEVMNHLWGAEKVKEMVAEYGDATDTDYIQELWLAAENIQLDKDRGLTRSMRRKNKTGKRKQERFIQEYLAQEIGKKFQQHRHGATEPMAKEQVETLNKIGPKYEGETGFSYLSEPEKEEEPVPEESSPKTGSKWTENAHKILTKDPYAGTGKNPLD